MLGWFYWEYLLNMHDAECKRRLYNMAFVRIIIVKCFGYVNFDMHSTCFHYNERDDDVDCCYHYDYY